MQLAQSEIMKAETEFGRDIGVRILLVRQADIQSDGLGSDVECSAVGRLHHPGSAAGHNGGVAFANALICRRHETSKFAGDL